jgi:hypothetical protein
MHRRISLLLAVFLIVLTGLTACNGGTTGSSVFGSTPIPDTVMTANPESSTAVNTSSPSSTPISVVGALTPIVIEQPTAVMTATLNSVPEIQENRTSLLNVNRPGPNSKLTSPIMVTAFANPGDGRKVSVQLFGEDGRLMADQLIKLQDSETGWVSFSAEIPFEIHTATESASLVLTTYDKVFRRIASLNIPLILMQIGETETESPGFQYQPFYFTKPADQAVISGGEFHVEGFAHPYNLNPVIIELIKENGAILATQIVPIKAPAASANYTTFSTDITYKVFETTPVRMTIRQMMDHPPYLDLALSSITITLKP